MARHSIIEDTTACPSGRISASQARRKSAPPPARLSERPPEVGWGAATGGLSLWPRSNCARHIELRLFTPAREPLALEQQTSPAGPVRSKRAAGDMRYRDK